jgi:hypothetical protein
VTLGGNLAEFHINDPSRDEFSPGTDNIGEVNTIDNTHKFTLQLFLQLYNVLYIELRT